MHIIARNPFFYRTILFLAFFEAISLFAYLLPSFHPIAFVFIAVGALILACVEIEYALYVLLIELFVGSKGFLFYWTIDNTIISLRIVLWLIVMGVWCARFFLLREERMFWKQMVQKPLIRLLLFFFGVLFLATLHGAARNAFADVFFDVNGWLFLLLLFPMLSTFRTAAHWERILHVLFASVLFSSAKALLVLYVYSHDPFGGAFLPLYGWVRNSGVGEITRVTPTFTRIFFQSQIYALIVFFMLLQPAREWTLSPRLRFTFMVAAGSALLLSFSRSFWFAGIVTLGLFFAWHILHRVPSRELWRSLKLCFSVGVASALLIIVVMNFPYPRTEGGSFASLIEDRVTTTEESGVSSRWNLLPPLLDAIRADWFWGAGFGKTVTYKSSDPRIVESSARGNSFYTTYAFEWGYLDLWLKLGLVGLSLYVLLFCKIFRALSQRTEYTGLLFGFIALLATNVFSPYLNHPLGIGYLLLLLVALSVDVDKSSIL